MHNVVELHGRVHTAPTGALVDGEPRAWAQVVTAERYPPPYRDPGLQIDHHQVEARGEAARTLLTLRPGDPIVVHGRLRLNLYQVPEEHLDVEVLASRIETPASVESMNRVELGGQLLMEPQDCHLGRRPGVSFPLAVCPSFGIDDRFPIEDITFLRVYAAGDLGRTLRTTTIYTYLALRGHLTTRTQHPASDEVTVVEMVATTMR